MIDERWVLLGVVINLVGSATYALSTLRGHTKPNRVTWLLWFIIPMIVLAGQLDQKVQWQALLTFMAGFGPFIVLAASLKNKDSYWEVTKLDKICGVLSLLAITLWLITSNPNLAIMLGIVADFLAAVPTLIKSYKYPETENHRAFRNATISSVITLLTISIWTFATYSFVIYMLAVNATLYLLIRFQLGKMLSRHFYVA